MLRSLTSAVSGLQNFQARLDVVGNNIANVNTTGFKSSRMDFADTFSQTLRAAVAGSPTRSNSATMQIGSGVSASAIRELNVQGALTRTGQASDMGIAGEGYFIVRNTVTNNELVTRAGDFRQDNQNYIVNSLGYRVQGFSDAALTTRGDIKIDTVGAPATADPAATVSSWGVDIEGKINVTLTDGTQFVRGQILLQNFLDPQALVKEGSNLYSGIEIAGPLGGATPAGAAPQTTGLGSIQAFHLELSNVDLGSEFATLITTQRAFQATSRVITTSDQVLQELVNLKQ